MQVKVILTWSEKHIPVYCMGGDDLPTTTSGSMRLRCMGVKDRLGMLLDVSDRKCGRMHEHTVFQSLVV